MKNIVDMTPLVSVDLLVGFNGPCGERLYLLGKRTNSPAKGSMFVPGARVYKNEPITETIRRIAQTECGIAQYSAPIRRGLYEHWYPDSFHSDATPTHYFSLCYEITIDSARDTMVDIQHEYFRHLSKSEILDSPDVHKYTKYFFIPNATNRLQ